MGAYSAPPDPLAGFKRPTLKGRGRKGGEVKTTEGKGKGEGTGGGREKREGEGPYRHFFFPTSGPACNCASVQKCRYASMVVTSHKSIA